MGAALYFVEGAVSGGETVIAAAGLGYAFPARGANARQAATGPGAFPGVVLSADDGARNGFYPELQTWRLISPAGVRPEGSRVWFGYATAERPRPEDLWRVDAIGGRPVKMFDGSELVAPVAYECDAGGQYFSVLPASAVLDENGVWKRGAVPARFARLQALADQFWRAFESPDATGRVVVAEARDMAAEALGENYRVSRWELSALEMFDNAGDVALAVLKVLCDFDGLMELQKKTEEPADG